MIRKLSYPFLALLVSMTLNVSTASAHPDEPEAFAPVPLTVQSGAAVLVAGGFMVAGQYVMPDSLMGTQGDFGDLLLGMSLAVVGPLVLTPVTVNATGAQMGYQSRHLGAYVGSLAGAIVGLPSGLKLGSVFNNDWLGYGVYTLGVVAGSLVGYHVQARADGAGMESRGQSLQSVDSGPAPGEVQLLHWQVRF
jgi:hypothetical protein